MPKRFELEELEELARILGYNIIQLPERNDCCYMLVPTPRAEFHEAGLDVIPVEEQKVDEWELYSKLAFAAERFIVELMSKLRDSLEHPDHATHGDKLRDLAVYLKLPVEYMASSLSWRAAFKICDSLLELAKQLHAVQTEMRR